MMLARAIDHISIKNAPDYASLDEYEAATYRGGEINPNEPSG
jgi:hypothetical protein